MNKTVTVGKTDAGTAEPVRADLLRGLSQNEVERSAEEYGRNELTRRRRKPFIAEFFKNLSDPIIRILVCAMGVNIALTFRRINWVEIGGIGATVLIATLVSTISEHSSSRAYEKLAGGAAARYTVIRDGAERTVDGGGIVVFDLVRLEAGDVVPCDGAIVGGSVRLDQSSLTGESRPTEKTPDGGICRLLCSGTVPEGTPSDGYFLPAGASVVTGGCTMAALAVGDSTAYGRIAAEVQGKEAPSPLKERLKKLAGLISRIGYAAAAAVAAAYLFNSFVIGANFDPAAIRERITDVRFAAAELLRALTFAVSIVVVAVPEGLPMMITVVLSLNMKKMMKRGVVVKKLVGIETAGNLSLLFTDKTGTVTTGRMTVTEVLTAEGSYRTGAELKKAGEAARQIAAAATLSAPSPGDATGKAAEAFVSAYRPAGMRAEARVPFDPARKYAAVLVADGKTGGKRTLIRGAPELILPRCTEAQGADGVFPLKGKDASEIRRLTEEREGEAVRVLAQASAPPEAMEQLAAGTVPEGLTFTCVFFIRDEIRPEVRGAAETCREAGVRVVMITGDGGVTAAAVAQRAGILTGRYSTEPGGGDGVPLVLSSRQIGAMTDGELAAALPRISVIYRVTPSDKSRLVRVARAAGHVVGMTGDGVNDAPALKAADVGFAMGSGTEVAKEAGDIVISDDNFASITRAILYGRTIFESIRKFISFQLVMNLCAVGVSVVGPLIGVETPITVPQMLWINIIMDTLGSLAFAGEPPLGSSMKKPPRRRDEPILSRDTVKGILTRGAFSLAVLLWFMASGFTKARFGGGDGTYRMTVFFALFVFFGIANSLCARCTRVNLLAGLAKNAPFCLIMGAVAAIQLLLVRFGGDVFRTVPIPAGDLLFAAALSAAVFPADLLSKTVLTRKKRAPRVTGVTRTRFCANR